jgi:hypothetical protein
MLMGRHPDPRPQTLPAAWPVWDRAAEMILVAATTAKPTDVAEAMRQPLVALEREKWWKATKRAAWLR